MKKFITALLLLFTFQTALVVGVGQASAVDIFHGFCSSSSAASSTGVCIDSKQGQNSKVNPIAETIGVAVIVLSYLVGIAAVLGIIVNGIRMMVASGDPNAIASARNGLVYCLVGLAVAALTGVTVQIIIGKLLQ